MDDTSLQGDEAHRLWTEGKFSGAGVGRGSSLRVRSEIRSDLLCRIESTSSSPGMATYFSAVEELALAVNRRLFLGCLDFEAHPAVYPPGAFYHKHLDRFPAVAHRLVSVILYLDPHWRSEDGGQLRLSLGDGGTGPTHDVLPEAGTLVAFLAGQVHHEVLPTNRNRWSITGWLRARA